MQVLVLLDPLRYELSKDWNPWDLLELIDARFEEGDGWGPWMTQGARKELAAEYDSPDAVMKRGKEAAAEIQEQERIITDVAQAESQLRGEMQNLKEQKDADRKKHEEQSVAQRAKHVAKQREQERAERTRKWTDSSGKFSVTAEFSGVMHNTVLLRRADGNTLRIPIARLSDTDRNWIEDRLNASKKQTAQQPATSAKNN
jgi:hypothetical protein